ncbi:MAG: sigma 54-interacting transcriptional regulator [Candidatus Latescibacteria bacterium]|nr:sigma 54-interacting transcriptional regulator [Candidatus Latescibacterota bacterium]
MSTLVRLSFFAPSAQLDDFAALYDHQLVPLLRSHGLEAGISDDRPYVAGVFSRLFAVESPTSLIHTQQALRLDPAWQSNLKALEDRLGVSVRHHLGIYSTPAGEGQVKEAGPGRRQELWHTLSVADGLGSPLISEFLLDREGRLWIGTWDGLSCFDGAQFINYTQADGLPGPKVRSLAQDLEGNLWVGTGGFIDSTGWGMCRFDGHEWVSFTEADGLAGDWVSALAVDPQGRVWLATDKGVSCFDGQRFTTYTAQEGLSHDYTWSLLVDQQGVLWAGSYYGVSRWEGEQFVRLGLPLGTPSCPVEKVEGLLVDRQGVLWVGLSDGVACWDGQEFTRLSQDCEGKRIVEDAQGQIWWTTYASGVCCWSQGRTRQFDTTNGLANNQVVALAADQEGQVWAGTQGGGICRYEGNRFFTLTTREGLADSGLYTLKEDSKGRLWVGTFRGVSCWDGQGFTLLNIDTGTDQWRNAAMAIHDDQQGGLWFVTFRGEVKHYDGQEVVTLLRSEGRNSYKHTGRSMVEDRQGRLWCATGEPGLFCYDQEQWRTYTQADGLVEDDVRAIGLDRQGQVWFATAHGGVSRYDGQQFATMTTGEGLGHAAGRVILEDRQGRLWFATDGGGVSRWDGHQFRRYTTAEGLAYDRVFAIMEDAQGRLWFGTQGGGVSIYDGQVFQTLSTQDGLANDAVQEIVRTRQGQVWVATEGGITRYQPAKQPPGVRLTQITADRPYAPTGPLSVSHSQGLIRFEFQGKSFTSQPDRLVYRYRLEGHDPDWKTTRARRVEYLYVPLGEYTFEVQSVDPDLNYSAPATVKLEVVPDPEVEALQATVSNMGGKGKFVGTSPVMVEAMEQMRRVADTDLTVLILGETGTGKGLAAQYVHYWSRRQGAPFIAVNCGAIPQGLEESELFGYEKGAFTGADHLKLGKVELARGGTLFLDEIGDLPPTVQTKLLHLVQEHTFERVGGTQALEAPARIIAATNRDLVVMVREGTFRADLYFRLKVYEVHLPPLRERKEDIAALAAQFIEPIAVHLAKQIRPLSPRILELLHAYPWPGNVRELEHVLQRAVIVCQGPEIRPSDLALGELGALLPDPSHANGQADGNGQVYLMEEIERRHIQSVLEKTGWKIEGAKGAAGLLGMAPSTLRSRMQKLGISRG